jgi:hypothetical protein
MITGGVCTRCTAHSSAIALAPERPGEGPVCAASRMHPCTAQPALREALDECTGVLMIVLRCCSHSCCR